MAQGEANPADSSANNLSSPNQSAGLIQNSLNAQKKEYEGLWKFIYLAFSISGAFLAQKIYKFQTLPEFETVRKGTLIDLLLFSLPFAACFILFDLLVHYLLDAWCQKNYLTESKYEGKARKKRAYTLVKWAYSLIYYATSSIAAYYIIKPTSLFPTWLGGTGSCLNIYATAPILNEDTPAMKIFYLLQFGKHIARLFSHMFIRAEGNYYQYILHHSLSSFLIGYSFLINQWLIGVLVLMLHDTSDFFLILARAYRDYKNFSRKILNVLYVLGFCAWVFCRLVIFPICCVYPSWTTFHPEDPLFYDIMVVPIFVMAGMMLTLFALQIFWTYYIMQSFLSVSVTNKITHNYD